MSERPGRPGWIARLALVLIPLIGVVALFEAVLRVVFPLDLGSARHYRVPHPTLGWSLDANAAYTNAIGPLQVPVAYNRRGWRDVLHEPVPEPGVERIVVLGDSFMEGYSVAMEDLFARRLERELALAGRRVEAVNLGVGGFGTLQELLAFRLEGTRYRPDLVVLGFSENDLSNNLQALERMANPDDHIKSSSRPFLAPGDGWQISVVDYEGALERFRAGRLREERSLATKLARNSALVQQVGRGVKRFKRMLKYQRVAEEAESAQPSAACNALYEQAWQVTERIMAQLQREVRAAGAELWLFSVPFIDQADVRSAREARSCKPCVCATSNPPESQLAQIAERLGIPWVDLYPRISDPAGGDPRRFYHAEDAHWNTAGHALAAKAVAEALAAQ